MNRETKPSAQTVRGRLARWALRITAGARIDPVDPHQM